MKTSLTPSWLHKSSAFLVGVVGSVAAWQWTDVVDASTAATIVAVMGIAKFALELITPDVSDRGEG